MQEYIEADALSLESPKPHAAQIDELRPLCENMREKCEQRLYSQFLSCQSFTTPKTGQKLLDDIAEADAWNMENAVQYPAETGEQNIIRRNAFSIKL